MSATVKALRAQEGWPKPLAGVCTNMWLKQGLGTLAVPVRLLSSWRDLGGSAGEGALAAGLCQPRGDEVPAGQRILGLSLR